MSQQPFSLDDIGRWVLEHPSNYTYRRLYTEATGIVPSLPSENRATNLDVWYAWGRECIWHLEAKCEMGATECPLHRHYEKRLEDVQSMIIKLEGKAQ